MLGSSEAPALPPFVPTLQPQVAQPVVEQIGAGTQEPGDTDPTLQHAVDKDTDKDSSGLVLPLARIKRIIKSEGDVKAVSSEASFAVARAAELLLEELARRANIQMQSQHRSTLQYKDVDIVPQPVAVSTLLEKYRQQHPELVHQQTNGTAVAPTAAASQQQAQQVAQQPGQQPAQQLVQQLAQQHAQQHAQPNSVPQRPAHSIFSQSQVQNAHAQNPLHGQQLAQLVHPHMQHFPVAEQVQHLLPPRLPVSTAVSQAAASQAPSLSQYQSLGQLQGLLSQQQMLSQQQAVAQQQALAQQAKQHALAQQAINQQQGSGQPTLGQQLLAQQQALGQQKAAAQQQQQQAVPQQQQQQQQQAVSQPQQPAISQQQQQRAMAQKLQQQTLPHQQQQQQQQQQQALPQQQQPQHHAVSQQQLAAQHQALGNPQPKAQQGHM